MITIALSVVAAAAVYRMALAATVGAPAGTLRARINETLGGGGPIPIK